MDQKKVLLLFRILLIVGILLSAFLIYEHFRVSESEFCKFGASFDCGIVNKSPYANLDGISYLLTIDYKLSLPLVDISGINWFFDLLTSNAFLGGLTLAFILWLTFKLDSGQRFLWIKDGQKIYWIRGLMIFGFLYGLYLIYIQHSILKSFCIFCLTLDVILISSLIVSFVLKGDKK